MTVNLSDREPKRCICLGQAIALLLTQVDPGDIAPEAIVSRYPRREYGEVRPGIFGYYFMSTENRNIAEYLPTVNSFCFEPGEFGNGRVYGFPIQETYPVADMVQAQHAINQEQL
jgi:hypothetical protein